MIRSAALALALAPLAASAAPVSPTMTLAEAKALSPQELAERLLGAAGASSGFVEAKVVALPTGTISGGGLGAVMLYGRPTSAGYAGLCEVSGIYIGFDAAKNERPGDRPRRVGNFWKLRKFAMLAPTDTRIADGGGKGQAAACAALGPVADRTDPVFFSVRGDNPADAYFAMMALAKAQSAAPRMGAAVTCREGNGVTPATCADAVVAVPIRRIHYVEVKPCSTGGMCVHALWQKATNGNDQLTMVELDVRTAAASADPPVDFQVVGIAFALGVWIVD